MSRALTLMAAMLAFTALVPMTALGQESSDWAAEQTEARRQEIIRRYRSLLENRPVLGPVFDRLLQEVGGGRAFQRLVEDYERLAQERPDHLAYAMILGHLYLSSLALDQAVASYRRACEIQPDSALPWRALADALVQAREVDEAREAYETALERAAGDPMQEQILFALADIAFSQRRFDEASSYFERIIALDPRDIYLRQQLAETLYEYGRYEEALAQYVVIAELAGRDTRQRALNLAAMGDLLVEMDRTDEALAHYREAQGLVRRTSWMWDDIEQRIIEAHRASGNLDELIAQYEARSRRSTAEQLRLLTGLYREVGRIEDALATARRAVQASGRSVDARLDLIQLLERLGEWDEVIDQYRILVQSSDEAVHHFRLAEILRQVGQEEGSLNVLSQMQRQYRNSTSVLGQLADLYLRWGHQETARQIYGRLLELEPDSPDLIITLGEFELMEGRHDEAVRIWARILDIVPDPSQARALLAQVYAEHQMFEESMETYALAVADGQGDESIRVDYALVLEENRRFSQALDLWTELAQNGSDGDVRSQARSRIIAIYQAQGTLRGRLADYVERFEGVPPDREAGYFLGEAYLAMGDRQAAEAVFLAILEGQPDDLEALLPLARLHEEGNRIAEAIQVLEQVARLDADWAQQHYYHLAELCLRIFRDDQAIHFASLAVAASPYDPRGHARLGQIYLRMGRFDRAVDAFLEAIRLDRRGSGYNLDLARVYLQLGRSADADTLLRQVVRQSRDPVTVSQAGELAIQLNRASGTLLDLLAEWEPLVHRSQAQVETRRLIVDLAEELVAPIAGRVRGLDLDEAMTALGELEAVSPRLAASLLPILADEDRNLALEALTVLAELPLDVLALPLSRLLVDPDREIRTEAALALGRLAQAGSGEFLMTAAGEPDVAVRTVIAWSIGQVGASGALAVLGDLLAHDPSPLVRAMTAISLGFIGDAATAVRLMDAASSGDDLVRRASLFALGVLSDRSALETLVAALADASEPIRLTAAFALGRLSSSVPSVTALTRAYWRDPSLRVRFAAGLSLRGLDGENASAGGRFTMSRLQRYRLTLPSLQSPSSFLDSLVETDSAVFMGSARAGLMESGRAFLPEPGSAVLDRYLENLSSVLVEILESGNTQVILRVLTDLSSTERGLGLGLLTWEGERSPHEGWMDSGLETPALGLEASLVRLLDSPETAIRTQALLILARVGAGDCPRSAEKVVSLLDDAEAGVRRQAAMVLGSCPGSGVGEVLAAHTTDPDCLVRAAVARSLGAIGAEPGMARLQAQLTGDTCVLARGGAAQGLALAQGLQALPLLREALEGSSAQMRAEIAGALALIEGEESRRILESMRDDPSPVVRTVAERGLAAFQP